MKRRRTTIILPTRDRPRRLPIVPVLVLLHSDLWVEVYAPEHVHAVIVNYLDSAADPALLDAYLESQLPRPHGDIYVPHNLRAACMWEKRTAESEMLRLWRLGLLKALERIPQCPHSS